ncbi:MFS transporter [Novosphingobium sp. P6W]|uniref:MFS transporter n=1 Tax=Novosphingobium sp. P6W TaxID=1609758 RepID=UPI0005C2D846|nr:MFS transporter [Novosphingobium sp. P6W]AXB79348.1 MFS transporter [Novosphingobium sp. P6W]KIS34123.1 general substrate transporter [Novosphingobium sp. P6W]
MTTTALPAGGEALRPTPSKKDITRALASAMIGNWFELFDFIIYGYFAAQIGIAMFPAADPVTTILSSFATYGVGFVMRPVGSMVLGSMGDRFGRKSALVLTMMLMAFATCATGLIPTYTTIGLAAPLLLVACRLIQGFAAGGEWGGATTFLVEYAPPHRRGLFGALQQLSTSLAVVSAVLVALTLNAVLSPEDLQAWGWRVPFVGGILIAPLGFYLRAKVPETPNFQAEAERPTHPLREALTIHRRTVLTIGGMVTIWTVAGYTYGTFLVSFASQVLEVPSRYALTGTLVGALCNVAVIPLAGFASDYVGRKPFLIASATGFLFCSIPLFTLMAEHRTGTSVIIATAVAGVFSGLFSGTAPTYLCELLPTRVRYTALSVGYNGAVMLFGGFAPFIATLLIRLTGAPIAPAFYVTAAAALSLIVIACVRAPDPAIAIDQ